MQRMLIFVCAILLNFFNSTFTYAGKELCPRDSVHCSYVTGLSDDFNDGRYIKLSNSKLNLVVCFNNYGLAFIDQSGAAKHVGKNADQYSICSDASGKHCEAIGLDAFIISQNKREFIAEPKYFEINLAQFKNNYPTCASYKSPINLASA